MFNSKNILNVNVNGIKINPIINYKKDIKLNACNEIAIAYGSKLRISNIR
jgi:hypothetical protein